MTATTDRRPARAGASRRRDRARPPMPRDFVAGHITGLDGLRAFAVTVVLVFHLWPERLPGGFLGVDVFFVISGFLITTLLLRERKRTGRIDLTEFWRRRARRLLPALVVVVVASTLAARLVSRELLVDIDRQVLGAFTFSTNWVEIRAGADYFDHGTPTLFATFWSLAVEEQFYVVWPILVLALLAMTRTARDRVRLTAAVAVVSALLMAILFRPGGNPTRVYYGTDTHLFGLMAGAALAFAYAGNVGILAQRRWLLLRQWVGFVAVVLLAMLMFVVDSESALTYRGGIVIATILSTIAVAALPGPNTAFSRVGELAPLVWLGRRSYGIYLWHWPVILVVGYTWPSPDGGLSPRAAALAVAVTFALVEATYRFVEQPIRRDGLGAIAQVLGRRPGVQFALIIIVVLSTAAVLTAPDKSAAQLSVEAGQRAIADAAVDGAPTPAAAPAPPASTNAPTTTAVAATTTAATTTTSATVPATTPPAEELAAWTSDMAVPPGELIYGFGDSVMSGAAPALYDRFAGIALSAKPNRKWVDAPPLIQWCLDNDVLRPVVVLSFGANAGLVSDGSVDALRTTLDLIGPDRRVVIVNSMSTSSWIGSSNQTLAAVADEYPNVTVADWYSVASQRPELLHDDRTHPNMDGIEVYAGVVADALERLGPG